MKADTRLVLLHLLDQAKDNLSEGKCNLNEEESLSVIESLRSILFPKPIMDAYNISQACDKLHISQPTFRKYVKQGKIPEGNKVPGFKELLWYKSDIDDLIL